VSSITVASFMRICIPERDEIQLLGSPCCMYVVVCVCVFFYLFITQHAPLHSNITCFT